jgi:hypothetical protein
VCYAVVLISPGLGHHSSKQRDSVLLTQLHRLHCAGWDARLTSEPFMQGQQDTFDDVAAHFMWPGETTQMCLGVLNNR